MGEEWQQNPGYNPQDGHGPEDSSDPDETPQDAPNSDEAPEAPGEGSQLFNQENIDKRLDDIRRLVVQGANEATRRFNRVAGRATEYWQQASGQPTPHRSSNMEEERIRQLANMWSSGNWQIARELGNYMDIVSWSEDEIWEVNLQTRWETRRVETSSEPYTGRAPGLMRPILPIWDYELPEVTGLKAPDTRIRLEGNDEIVSCDACNSTGHLLCAACAGRGWTVCSDCKGRTRVRCETCRGRAYVADWVDQKKKPFLQRRTERLASSFNEKISDVFDGIRQQGLPLPNPIDVDPASKGRTVPCPDCVNGEVECTCGTGKRICASCHGSKTELCDRCSGTGRIVRHRDLVRHFDLKLQSDFVGIGSLPAEQIRDTTGELVYSAEITELLYPEAPPEAVPIDIWRSAVHQVENSKAPEETGYRPAGSGSASQGESRPSLQVLELVRIPYTHVNYRYNNQDYALYIYDVDGKEKFYSERYPARWDRIERLMKSISADLTTPTQQQSTPPAPPASQTNNHMRGYRVPIEQIPYTPPSYTLPDDENEEE